MKNKVWIKSNYKNYYDLVNKISAVSTNYELVKKKNYLLIKLSFEDYQRLIKYLVSYKFVLVKNTGLLYIKDLIKEHFIFLLCSIIGLIFLFFLTNVIVDVEILHENSEIISLLDKELKNYGINSLTIKKDYEEISFIKDEILSKYQNELDWLEITTEGMKYVVRAEERIITSVENQEDYCNVYASKSGLVTGINISKGVSLVKIGDYVNEGDILISGDIYFDEENIVDEVCAKGVVTLESWYTVDVSIPFNYFIDELTEQSRYNLMFSYNNKEIRLLKDRVDDYASFYTEIFTLFGYSLYLEKQTEVNRVYYSYSEEEALNQALELAIDNLLLKLNEEDEIIDEKVLKKTVNDSTIDVEIFIITNEVMS